MGVHQKLITDSFKFRLDFMPEENRKIRPIGVSLFNRTYWAPELSHHIGLRNVTIKYDPFALYTIWAKIEGSYIELRFADLTQDNLSYEQHLITNKHSYRTSSKGMLENVVVARDGNEQEVRESIKKTRQSKKKLKAAEAYSKHVLDQHFDPSERVPKPVARAEIDFTKGPVIYDSEVV